MGMALSHVLKWGCFVFILVSIPPMFIFAYMGEWIRAFVWFVIGMNGLLNYVVIRDVIREQTALDEELERLKNDYRS